MSSREQNIAKSQLISEIQQRVIDKLNKERINIAIIGSKNYDNKTKIKDFIYKLSITKKADVTILSGGRTTGADKIVRQTAISFGMQYIEYNPAHTVENIYSHPITQGYGQPFNMKNIYGRNIKMILACKKLVIFWPDGVEFDSEFKHIIKFANEVNKKIIIIS